MGSTTPNASAPRTFSSPDRADSMRAATASIVGSANSHIRGTSIPSLDPRTDTTVTAISEFPPTSKKLSSRPIRSTPTTSSITVATTFSTSVAGARYTLVTNSGAGKAFRSTLPLALSGIASRTVTVAGTMYDGRLAVSQDFNSSAPTVVSGSATTYPTNRSPRSSLYTSTTALATDS